MARWVAHPLGTNAPRQTKFTTEMDLEKTTEAVTSINESIENNEHILVIRDNYGDYGLLLQGSLSGWNHVGIAFCPWCGEGLETGDEAVGKLLVDFNGRFSQFDDREMTFDRFPTGGHGWYPRDVINLAITEKIEGVTVETPLIEALIRLQGWMDTDPGYRPYAPEEGRYVFDFDKEWPPKDLAAVADYCSQHKDNPDLALWKLLARAEQPAVWALALLDLAAKDIPGLDNITFDVHNTEPLIVIECRSIRYWQEASAFTTESQIKLGALFGKDWSTGEPVPYKDEIDKEAKDFNVLAKTHGYDAKLSDPEKGKLIFSIPIAYRDDVLTYLRQLKKED
jgi:hypothetical protein